MTLIFSTLLGKTTQCRIDRDEDERHLNLENMWTKETEKVQKVNALVANDRRINIGGLGKGGKGVIEIWNRNNAGVTRIPYPTND